MNQLKPRLAAIDPAAIAKAEAALKALSGSFAQWLANEVAKLEAARAEITASGTNAQTMESLYLRAHDLKGLGGTYGFPIVTRIGGLMCRLIEDKDKRLSVPLDLIDAHIDAIKVAVSDNITDEEHPAGAIMIQALERRAQAASVR